MIEYKKIRILMVEDMKIDSDLIIMELIRGSLDFVSKIVDNEEDFTEEIDLFKPDIIFSDYNLPMFDGVTALEITKNICPDIPFIIISGTIGEEKLVKIFKNGATDFIIKDRLERLVPSVKRALQEAKYKLQKGSYEANLYALIENTNNSIWAVNLELELLIFNSIFEDRFEDLYHFKPKIGMKIDKYLGEKELRKWEEYYYRALEGEKFTIEDFSYINKVSTYFEISFYPIVTNNKISGITVYSKDITEKKAHETQLFRAQRLEVIGSLSNGIAHDLNNIFSPILLAIEILKMRLIDESCKRIISMVESSANRGVNIVKQILTFSNPGINHQTINILSIINDIQKIINETFPKSLTLNINIEDNIWNILGNSTQLYQVLLNLCVNSRDAMPNGGKLTISANNIIIDKNYKLGKKILKEGKYLFLSISDTGEGIPAEIMQKIFDPFFTTKEIGKGTGIGLSTVSTIIQNHNGFIDVYSEPNNGTNFKIYLPAIVSEYIKKEVPSNSDISIGSGELILVVDDEELIRDIIIENLEMYGYKVIVAENGIDAIELYKENKNEIKVLITDMNMPKMDGLTFIKTIKEIDQNVKIIAVSGLTENYKKLEFLVDDFLEKPFNSKQLLNTLYKVISNIKK
ncbi:MAG: response regulator [Cyanobacteriota bacterium]